MALVEDEDEALVVERFEQVGVFFPAELFAVLIAFALFVQRKAELLDRGDDDLVGVIIGE